MYLVISRWTSLPGREREFEEAGRKVRNILRQQPGVLMVETFRSGDSYVSAHAYKDEETYHRLIDDSQGAFAIAVQTYGLEQLGQWEGSERGSTLA